MRPMLLTTALATGLMMAAAAIAAPAPTSATPIPALAPAPIDEPLPPIAEDQAQADAMTAQLAALDARISADDARITQLRDPELAQENARIRAIKPALPFVAPTHLHLHFHRL